MNITSKTPRIELVLRAREVLSLENRQQPVAIECKDGVVWITRAGGHGDHILSAGNRYIPTAKGNIVIEAIGKSRVHIEEKS